LLFDAVLGTILYARSRLVIIDGRYLGPGEIRGARIVDITRKR
jgi:hypothetical protein